MKILALAAATIMVAPSAAFALPYPILPYPTVSRDRAGGLRCLMERSNGEILDLSSLCNSTPRTTTLPAARSTANIATRPLAGTTCEDFDHQLEALYHFNLGTAPRSMDGDSDGIPCEMLSQVEREGGDRIWSSTFTNGNFTELIRDAGRTDVFYYLRVRAGNLGTFTTRLFSDDARARAHASCYYSEDLQDCSGL